MNLAIALKLFATAPSFARGQDGSRLRLSLILPTRKRLYLRISAWFVYRVGKMQMETSVLPVGTVKL